MNNEVFIPCIREKLIVRASSLEKKYYNLNINYHYSPP